jgi:AcrR family transcriptional regulator
VPKDRYHHGQLRDALLDAAELLVAEHGIDGWSLREASAGVGVAASAAYHHFASREALVSALAERVLTGLGERMRRSTTHARADDPVQPLLSGDGLIRHRSRRAADLEAERLVRALLTGLNDQATPIANWPAPQTAHTERVAAQP